MIADQRTVPATEGGKTTPARPRRWLRWSLIAVLLLGVADAAWVAWSLTSGMTQMRARLVAGGELLRQGHAGGAARQFRLADEAAADLGSWLAHPAAWAAGAIPGLSDDVEAVEALVGAGASLARSGLDLVDAASAIGWDGLRATELLSDGEVDVRLLRSILPDLLAADRALTTARRALVPIRTDGLPGSLGDAFEQARGEVVETSRVVHRATLLARLLSSLLGDREPRRYLLIVQNLSDPRGSGGHVGSHGIVEVDGGRIRLVGMAATAGLPAGPAVATTTDVGARYERFGSLTHLMAATYPPDFPTAAELLIAGWRSRGNGRLDGVVSVDSVAMSYLLAATGPVSTSAWPEPIAASNVSDVLDRATFALPGDRSSNAVQSSLARSLWRSLLDGWEASSAFAAALTRSARERHLQLYSSHPVEQVAIRELGAGGELPRSRAPLLVAWFGASDARTGYFAVKDVRYEAALSSDGRADVTITASVRNLAPGGPPSILLGTGSPDAPVGSYHAYVNLYLPPGARVLGTRGGILALQEEEFGGPVVLGLVGARSGRTARFSVTFRWDGAVRAAGGSRRFDLDLVPLPALRPDRVHLAIHLPAGAEVLATSPGARVLGGAVTWEGAPVIPERFWIRFA